ncbi:GNAT family N-acetyltransferase [Myroides profundi]|uniref:N-acetylglutamate synthase, GNAT family n=1 Tax=Myroides profundi TaxID=480520 RepID=A0AAJ4W6G9_MYRPR|nr:GNAT family N-acetyltransferase [Myroides profundi]SER49007.1 N-acetylglutamate synthase, GNAT family [Myroides profundi]
MEIRKMEINDADVVANLLEQMGYPNTLGFLPHRIAEMNNCEREALLVVEDEGQVIAFISVHFIPQIALEGDFARISYFAVDQNIRSKGVGRLVEEHVTALAKSRGCDRIELHSHSRRTDAHRFYFRQGYEDVPKYLVKYLNPDSH